MTFSIIAHDPQSGSIGIAIASRFFAVGAICPFVFPGIGAIVTQAAGHPPFGSEAQLQLRNGRNSRSVIEALLAKDNNREQRQIHAIDSQGGFAGYTGTLCVPAAGHRQGPQFSIAGNMLASMEVLEHGAAAIDPDLPLARRLLAALTAAHATGGDKRGQQAAALIVYGRQEFPLLSLRVDDDDEAVPRLFTLYERAGEEYIPFMRRKATEGEAAAVFGP